MCAVARRGGARGVEPRELLLSVVIQRILQLLGPVAVNEVSHRLTETETAKIVKAFLFRCRVGVHEMNAGALMLAKCPTAQLRIKT